MEWISVKDSLPAVKDKQDVFVWYLDKPRIGEYLKNSKGWFVVGHGYVGDAIKYWMSTEVLPEPPKE